MRFMKTIDPKEFSVSSADYDRVVIGKLYTIAGRTAEVVKKEVAFVGGPTVTVKWVKIGGKSK